MKLNDRRLKDALSTKIQDDLTAGMRSLKESFSISIGLSIPRRVIFG
jgi:hypothetical protein